MSDLRVTVSVTPRTPGANNDGEVSNDPKVSRGNNEGGNQQIPDVVIEQGDYTITLSFKFVEPTGQNAGQAEGDLQNAEAEMLDENSFAATFKTQLSGAGELDLAALLIMFAASARQNALDDRLASREAAAADMKGQAAESREAAVKQLVAAVVMTVISVASAVVSGIGAAKTVGSTKDAVSSAKGAVDSAKSGKDALAGAQNTAANAAGGKVSHTNMVTQAVTQGMGAAGQVTEGSLNSSAKMDEADGQELGAEAQIHQSNSDIAKKIMDDLDEAIKAAIQFIKEMQRAETDLMQSMTRV